MSDKRQRRSPKGNLAKKQRSDDDSELMSIDEEKDEAAEVGIIQSISLKNFMCHSNLEFNFKPHVNFIIGKNGSGKSAILTGIVVGLGGKAAVTERARNFKTFIKNGKQVAEIAVKLRNYGSEAYKPEEYGSLIIVERKLTADGSSSYKLKNETGAVVSTKREELIHILDQFNIQVDNPVSVLNQETSRSFLNFKSAKDKYMFFLKATQLEQMMQDYTRTDETEKVIRDTLQRKKETLPELEKEVKDWQRRWKFHQSLDDQRKKLDRLRNEFAWAYVVEREREFDEKLNLVEEQKNCTPKFKSKVTETQENIGKLNKEKEKIQFELQRINEKTSAIQQEHINLKRELLARKTSLRNKELELRKASNEISPAKKEIDSLKKRIEELRMGDQQDYAIERQRRLKEIQLLEQQKASLLEEQKSFESSHKAKENLLSKMSDDIYNLRQEEQNKTLQIKSLDCTITNLEKSRTNQLRRFGAYMPELLERIELACKQGKFSCKPRGPIGSCIKLRDVQWALAVESCLSRYVSAFCCDNHQDERTLQQIMRNVIAEGRKPSIIVSKFHDEVYDVRKYSVKSDKYKSVLEMLEISDPVIANCLIDQRRIESILLIAENEEARNVMIDEVPHQCREAFTLVGDHLYPSPIFRYYSSTKKGADFLQGSVEDKIKEKKEEILDLRHRQHAIQSDINEANQRLKAYKSNYNEITKNLANVRQKIMELNVKISELNIEEPKPIDVTVLEEELETMQNHLKGLEQYEAKLLEDRDNAKVAARETETEYSHKDEELGSLFSRFDPLKDALGNIDSQIEQAKLHKQHYDKKLKDHEKKVAELEKDYGATKALLEADIKKANEISPRIRTQQSSHSIEIEINQIEKQLKQEEKSQGNREEVTSKYFETKRKYDQIKNDVKKIEDFIRSLNTIMIERKKAYDCFRKQLSMRVKYLFITSLAQRNYSGKIDFNHKKSLLELRVQPNSKSTELNEDMKALSGGERSFTTVCFILALWDAVESPFRILDEFDVFMDMVNRRISMDMMMETAMHKIKHQFIFLSPLDMTSLPASRRIQICRMPDPDRNENKSIGRKQN